MVKQVEPFVVEPGQFFLAEVVGHVHGQPLPRVRVTFHALLVLVQLIARYAIGTDSETGAGFAGYGAE